MKNPNRKLWIVLGSVALFMLVGSAFAGFVVPAMFVLFGVVMGAMSLHNLRDVFRPIHARPTWWSASGAPHMSRLSLVVTSALLACGAAWLFLHGFTATKRSTFPLFVVIAVLIATVPVMRWLDTGRWR